MNKVCTRCHVEKDCSQFGTTTSKYKESVYKRLKSHCKKCNAETQRISYSKMKDNPEFKEKNVRRAHEYSKKNYEEVKKRRKTAEYLKKHNDWEKKRYEKYKDFINERQRIRRQTPEYKAYMKEYRKRRKNIIYEQEKITKRKYQDKHRDNVTREYCFRLLKSQGIDVNEETLTEKQVRVIIDRIMNRLSELEKGTFRTCIMCNKSKSIKLFKHGENYARINTCNKCNYKSQKKRKYERYKRIKEPSI